MATQQGGARWSLTETLLSASPEAYKSATQSSFLVAAAQGRLSKQTLGRWLANDRLYIHSYTKAAGRTLDAVNLPQTVGKGPEAWPTPATELVDWIADTLVALRREERLFVDASRNYGLDINLKTAPDGLVRDSAKLPGLVLFENLFASVPPALAPGSVVGLGPAASDPSPVLPWLEAAVVLWGTERVYLDAWSWARAQQRSTAGKSEDDEDGGAARKEFIPNWSSHEFASFVDRLGRVLDRAVAEVLDGRDEVRAQISERALRKWSELLAAETAFWPEVE